MPPHRRAERAKQSTESTPSPASSATASRRLPPSSSTSGTTSGCSPLSGPHPLSLSIFPLMLSSRFLSPAPSAAPSAWNYMLKDLLQHADGIGVSSKHRRHGRQRVVHHAFARFVRTDPSFAQELAGITGIPGAIAPTDTNGAVSANATTEADVSAAGSNCAAAYMAPRPPEVEKYAWTWVCVLTADLGLNPEDFAGRVVMCSFVEVIPLFSDEIEDGETFAIVRFTNDWFGSAAFPVHYLGKSVSFLASCFGYHRERGRSSN
jgi:hypothetical protein